MWRQDVPRSAELHGHIPGAVHVSGFTLGGIRPGPEMPEPEAFARLVGAIGIDESTPGRIGPPDLLGPRG